MNAMARSTIFDSYSKPIWKGALSGEIGRFCVLTRRPKQANPSDSSMQTDEAQNAKGPIVAQIDLSGSTFSQRRSCETKPSAAWQNANHVLFLPFI